MWKAVGMKGVGDSTWRYVITYNCFPIANYKQVTTNLVAKRNKNVLPYSCGGQKS